MHQRTELARPHRLRSRGFSLVELMVVIVIIGLLAGTVIVMFGGQTEDAKVTTARAQVQQLYNEISVYRQRMEQRGIRPVLPEDLEMVLEGPPEWEGEWISNLSEIPNDPWGNEYLYQKNDRGQYRIVCLGADGEEGGEGYDADLVYPAAEVD